MRRPFTILSALSLLLCVAVCVLWVRSHRTPEELRWRVEQGHAYERWSATNRDGSLTLRTVRLTPAVFTVANYDVEPPFVGTEGGIEYRGRWVVDHAGGLRPQIVDFRDNGERLTVVREFLGFFPFLHGGSHRRRVWQVAGVRVYRASGPVGPVWQELLLFGAVHTADCVQRETSAVGIAHWLLAALLAAPPSLFAYSGVASMRRKRRRARGLCPACGYDLRATPGRCPECGRVPTGSVS
jgi:hypothetical protein